MYKYVCASALSLSLIAGSASAGSVDAATTEGTLATNSYEDGYNRLEYTFGAEFGGGVDIFARGGSGKQSYVEQLIIQFMNAMMDSTEGVIESVEIASDGGPDILKVAPLTDTGPFDTVVVDVKGSEDGGTVDVESVEISAVPLPAPALMLLAGLGALGMMRRKA